MTERWKFKVSDEDLEDLIHKYCRDLCAWEKAGRFDPITGRDNEIDQMILILLQKGRKNAVILAPAGVGKTALVVGLAQSVVKGNVPDYLKNARVLELDLPSMAAGTDSSAEFQERFVPLCKGFAERYSNPAYPKFILFIDEIHTIMPKVKGSAYAGLSEVMKPYLTVGDLHVIGATTLDEYRWYVQEDFALDRRFQKIHIRVPTAEETFRILQNIRAGYEKHHGVTISDESLLTIVHLTNEHMRRRTQPDKSIIMMDAAMAHHVKENGRGGEVSLASVYYMIGGESGLNPNALIDETMRKTLGKEVKRINDETEAQAQTKHDSKAAWRQYQAEMDKKLEESLAESPQVPPLPGGGLSRP